MSGSSPNPSTVSPLPVSSLTTSSIEEQHAESQRNLYQASVALEAAYDRVRRVRRSLLQLSGTLTASNSQPQSSTFDNRQIGPSHEAIILTGDPLVREDEQSTPASPPFFPPYPSPEQERQAPYHSRNSPAEGMRNLNLNSSGPSTTRRTLQPHPSSISQPFRSSGSPSHSLLHRSLSDASQSLQVGIHRDDPSTALGRRVAAREAAGRLNSSASHRDSNPADPGTLQYFGHFQRPDLGRLDPLIEDERDDIIARTLALEGRRSARPHPVSLRSQEARRLQGVRSDTRQLSRSSFSDRSERLSLLSNFPAQNLTTPLSSNIPRPLLFDEPSRYASAREEILDESPLRRNYVIHRRLGPDGEERVHNINLEWNDDDLPSWLLSRGRDQEDLPVFAAGPFRMSPSSSNNDQSSYDSRVHSTRTANTLVFPPEVLARRRGWARLDPDGNEIPSDEEEELERSRTEYRIRALYQARMSAQAASGSGTRSTHSQASYDGVTARTYNRNFRVAPVSYRTPEFSREATPFLVDPLPMSLSEMIPSSKSGETDDHIIIVPKHASLAGR